MTDIPRGRTAKFAYNAPIVAEFINTRAADRLDGAQKRRVTAWSRTKTATKPAVDAILTTLGLTERQLKDFGRRRGENVVLWDRTKAA